MGLIMIFGIEVDERCAEYLQLAVKFVNGWSDERVVARRAVKNLARNNCRKSLLFIISKYANGTSEERKLRDLAFDYLEKLDSGEEI